MQDLQEIRAHPDQVRAALARRGIEPPIETLLALDSDRRALLTQVEQLKAERNRVSKEIGQMKDASGREVRIGEMRTIGQHIEALDVSVREKETALHELLAGLPNVPDADVPDGGDETFNVVERTVGEPKRFDFEPRPHWDLGPALGILDFDRGIKLTGSRFYVLSGAGARLQRALIAWMLDLHTRQGYLEKYTPFVVREETLFAAGQLPKFRDNLYHDHEENLWLVPTAEVPLTGLHMDEILDGGTLPRRYTAYTPCFRREKMSAGRRRARHQARPPVRQGRDVHLLRAGGLGRRARAHAVARRANVRRPGLCLPGQEAVRRRPGLLGAQDVRRRGLGFRVR